jgi:hypothetical protein
MGDSSRVKTRSRVLDYIAAAMALVVMVGPVLVDWLRIDGFPRAGHEIAHVIAFAMAMRLWFASKPFGG